MKEITVHDLKKKKENGDDFILLDVRENFEYEISNLGGKLLPMGELPDRMAELDPHKNSEIILMCRSGARSGRACEFLQSQGFTNVANLKGGITAWAKEIDPTLPVA